MSDAIKDDAPLTTSKDQSRAVDEATEALIENKGNALVGRT
ncbi:MAG: cyclase, partial [Sphingomonas sp.]|nr:cyclase [Sphingomonas sp.]